MDDDDRIIRQRLDGRSMRAIAKAQRTTIADINEVIDRWAASAIDEKIRKNTLALELAWLDELQEVFCASAVDGGVQCGALATKNCRAPLRDARPDHAADCRAADCRRGEAAGNEHRPDRAGAQRSDRRPEENEPTTH